MTTRTKRKLKWFKDHGYTMHLKKVVKTGSKLKNRVIGFIWKGKIKEAV